MSYGYNDPFHRLAMAAVQSPATTVMAADANALPVVGQPGSQWKPEVGTTAPFLIDNASTRNTVAQQGSGDGADFTAPSARHLETCNVLWADGHVKALQVEKFYRADVANSCLNVNTGCQ